MPVFEAKNLDSDFTGHALLAAVLHPTRQAQTHALRHGRRRAARAAMLSDPMAIEPRFPVAGDELAPAAAPSN